MGRNKPLKPGASRACSPFEAWRKRAGTITPGGDPSSSQKPPKDTLETFVPSPEETPESLFKKHYGKRGETLLYEALHTDGALLCGVLRDSENKPIFAAYAPINRYIMVYAIMDVVSLDPEWAKHEASKAKQTFISTIKAHDLTNLCDRIRAMDSELPNDKKRLGPGKKSFDNDTIIGLCADTALRWLRNDKEQHPSLPDTEIPENHIE